MTTDIVITTGLIAGLIHALEADHVAAVTTFVSRRPHPLQALRFGIRWGLGHTLAVLGLGGVVILLDLRIPDTITHGLEFGVGTMLLGLGLWLLWSLLHEGVHRIGGEIEPPPRGATTWVGMAHGLAGTAPLIAILPVTLGSSPVLAGTFLFFTGVGLVVGMGSYAFIAGWLFHRAGRRSPAIIGICRGATALGSAAIGVVWMLGALDGGA